MRTWHEFRNFVSQKFSLTPDPVNPSPMLTAHLMSIGLDLDWTRI